MTVYHSSYCIVDKPDVLHSRDGLDFGKGFYVTVLRQQAILYAERYQLRGRKAYVNVYDLNDGWLEENVKSFDTYSAEWLDFVAANRMSKRVERYDAVEGGVANDKIFRTLELYFAGEITKDEALKRLVYEKPNHQICFLNQRLIYKYITYLGTEEL